MKKRIVASGYDDKQEARQILSDMKELFDRIEMCSNETYEYIPDKLVEDLDEYIREMHHNLHEGPSFDAKR